MVEVLLQARGGDSMWIRWLPRRVLAEWPRPQLDIPQILKALEAQFSDASVVNGACPHFWICPMVDAAG